MTTCKELAEKINAHLKRFEADKTINATSRTYGTRPYYCAGANATTRVWVWYVSYQGQSSLTKAEAKKYLEWLDAGNVGKHYTALSEGK